MYHAYWGLQHPPFSGRSATRGFYESSVAEEALARLMYLIENRKRLGILLGGSGLGKSTLLEMMKWQLQADHLPVARINLVAVSREELPGLLAEAFRVPLSEGASTAIAWRRLVSLLSETLYQNQTATILLDDADQADSETLKVVTRLMHTEAALAGRLTIVLALRAANLPTLPESLLDASELRIDLEPWTPQDTAGYLQQSLLQAGRAQAAFDDSAVACLHDLSGGIPRRIAQMADLAMLAGAGQRLEQVDAQTVTEVARELQPASSVPNAINR